MLHPQRALSLSLLSSLPFAPLGSHSCLIQSSPPSTEPHLTIPPPPILSSCSSLSSPIFSWTSLLHCPSSHSSSLFAFRFISSSWDSRGGCAEQATSDSCDALLGGHWQSWLFFSPLPQCFFLFFYSPAHCMLNVFRCPTFFEDGLECKNKSCCVSMVSPFLDRTACACLKRKSRSKAKTDAHIQMLWVHFYALCKSIVTQRKCLWNGSWWHMCTNRIICNWSVSLVFLNIMIIPLIRSIFHVIFPHLSPYLISFNKSSIRS